MMPHLVSGTVAPSPSSSRHAEQLARLSAQITAQFKALPLPISPQLQPPSHSHSSQLDLSRDAEMKSSDGGASKKRVNASDDDTDTERKQSPNNKRLKAGASRSSIPTVLAAPTRAAPPASAAAPRKPFSIFTLPIENLPPPPASPVDVLPPVSPTDTTTPTAGEEEAAKKKRVKKDPTYNRKDKSLGLLCENFIHTYTDKLDEIVSLDEAAKLLGVERRRIYDIVNILEAVGVVSRKGKNQYVWHGTTKVAERLTALKAVLERSEKETGGALAVGIHYMNNSVLGSEYKPPVAVLALVEARERDVKSDPQLLNEDPSANLMHHNTVLSAQLNAPPPVTLPLPVPQPSPAAPSAMPPIALSGTAPLDPSAPHALPPSFMPIIAPVAPNLAPTASSSSVSLIASASTSPNSSRSRSTMRDSVDTLSNARKEQSLGHLSQIFLQMFLLNATRILSLEDAAKYLLRGETGGAHSDPLQNPPTATAAAVKDDQSSSRDATASDSDSKLSSVKTEQPSESKQPKPRISVPVSVGGTDTASLPETAAKARAKDNKAASIFKSKVRRLYDIANVFTSLRLIEKIHLITSRKPAFHWKGGETGQEVYPLESTVPDDKFTAEALNRRDAAQKRKMQQREDAERLAKLKERQAQSGGYIKPVAAKREKREQEKEPKSKDQNETNGIKRLSSPPLLPLGLSKPGIEHAIAQMGGRGWSFSFAMSQLHGDMASKDNNHTASDTNDSNPSNPPRSSSASSTGSSVLDSPVPPVLIDIDNPDVYYFSNPPHSFSIERSQMGQFGPIDFAYLPFLAPTRFSVEEAVNAAAAVAATKSSTPAFAERPTQLELLEDLFDTVDRPPLFPPPLPCYMQSAPKVMQAGYIRDYRQFLDVFGDVCDAWVKQIPGLNIKAAAHLRQQRAEQSATGSAPKSRSTMVVDGRKSITVTL